MDAERVTDRASLRFANEVKTHFAFLEAKGFSCTRYEATLVRFESSKLSITVYHEKQSYEISLTIESLRGSDAYSFSEILRLAHSEQAERYRDYTAYTVEAVAEGVRKLAELFRKYVVDAGILNDAELFSRLKLQREKWARNYALDIQLKQALKKSESAWLEKDFGKVVQALAPLQEHLSSTDLKKLEYARKHFKASK